MTKYVGYDCGSHSHFGSADGVKNQPELLEPDCKKVFEIESDWYEEAADAWEKFMHHGSYRPVCPEYCDTIINGFGKPDERCQTCGGKGWITMELWRIIEKYDSGEDTKSN